ncbi:helix-turn-helix domain-containing protein [Agrobacterium tumefaciens]|uniref:helix-turn-helix domain-containing protein n=1 Tax=Agrobacterium tumefaciens TaxID=358 RepID=UPI001574D2D2|nr:helix-turn-helix domain-containing protein [Agrobacterium tumefaciens]NSZ65155.1 helix-turn-helix domain-containing protein [Agrobacterium tumefaciens]NTA71526.1 helix-turn-helix domain-containing protein [Agrobacterium tumefaciens]WIE40243.1 helix-turn-helix domain-containing protein [Agrobacterium tumefaciens]
MNDKPELPGKNDFAMAFKAIALARGLSGDAKTVGAVLLAHFNAKTGQCDPGTDRIAAKAGISTRNVVKATNALHQSGLVVKTRHGGNGFRSSYQPNWTKLREIVDAFAKDDGTAEIVNKRARTQCTNVHLHSEQTFTLTNIRNSLKELTDSDGASGRVEPVPSPRPIRPVSADRVQGLLRDSLRKAHRPKPQLPSVVAAQEAARHRLEDAIAALSPTMRDVIDERMTAEIQQEAIVAEVKRQGGGIAVVVERVSQMPKGGGA